jgi:hypothetical protein
LRGGWWPGGGGPYFLICIPILIFCPLSSVPFFHIVFSFDINLSSFPYFFFSLKSTVYLSLYLLLSVSNLLYSFILTFLQSSLRCTFPYISVASIYCAVYTFQNSFLQPQIYHILSSIPFFSLKSTIYISPYLSSASNTFLHTVLQSQIYHIHFSILFPSYKATVNLHGYLSSVSNLPHTPSSIPFFGFKHTFYLPPYLTSVLNLLHSFLHTFLQSQIYYCIPSPIPFFSLKSTTVYLPP